jgi:hypothetical protein
MFFNRKGGKRLIGKQPKTITVTPNNTVHYISVRYLLADSDVPDPDLNPNGQHIYFFMPHDLILKRDHVYSIDLGITLTHSDEPLYLSDRLQFYYDQKPPYEILEFYSVDEGGHEFSLSHMGKSIDPIVPDEPARIHVTIVARKDAILHYGQPIVSASVMHDNDRIDSLTYDYRKDDDLLH